MKKAFLIVLSLVFVASAAFATNARVEGMGVPVWMTQDDSLIWSYPSQVLNNENLATFELSNGTGEWGGVNLGLAGGILGLYVNVPGVDIPDTLNKLGAPTFPDSSLDTQTILDVSNQITVLYGLNLDDNMGLGFKVGFGRSSDKGTPKNDGDDDVSLSTTNIEAGVGLTMKGDIPLDVALDFAIPMISNVGEEFNVSNELTAKQEISGSSVGIGLSVRAGLAGMLLNLDAGLKMDELTSTYQEDNDGNENFEDTADDNDEEVAEETNINVALGASKKIEATDTLSLIVGGTVNIDSSSTSDVIKDKNADTKTTDETTSNIEISVPLYVAAEGKLNETWSVRGGISRSLYTMSNYSTKDNMDDPAYETETSESGVVADTNVSLGVSGVIGDFTIDAEVHQSLLNNGPYVVSGNSLTGDLFTNVSLKYAW